MTLTRVERIDEVYREFSRYRASADSADGLVSATVGPYGELRALDLDPRVYRDAGGLDGVIAATAGPAREIAEREVVEVLAPLLPPGTDLRSVDVAFDPVLWELDRELPSGLTAGTTLDTGMVVEISDDMALEDDMGMPFATHPWQIAVISQSKDVDAELEVARSLFEGLKATGRYSLFVTFDGQRLIDSAVVDGEPSDRRPELP